MWIYACSGGCVCVGGEFGAPRANTRGKHSRQLLLPCRRPLLASLLSSLSPMLLLVLCAYLRGLRAAAKKVCVCMCIVARASSGKLRGSPPCACLSSRLLRRRRLSFSSSVSCSPSETPTTNQYKRRGQKKKELRVGKRAQKTWSTLWGKRERARRFVSV